MWVPLLLGIALAGAFYGLYQLVVTPPAPPAIDGSAEIYVGDPAVLTTMTVRFGREDVLGDSGSIRCRAPVPSSRGRHPTGGVALAPRTRQSTLLAMESAAARGDVPDADHAFTLSDAVNDVVLLTWASGVHITADLAAAAMTQVNEHNEDHERPLLVDMTGIAALSRDAHKYFGQRSRISRVAIVGESPVDRVIANFGLRVSPPPVPSRFFNSRAAALAWLQATTP